MSKRTDLSGRQVGELTVIRPAPSIKGNTYWYCTCSCGRECIQPKSALIANPPRVKTCGHGKEDYLAKGRWGDIVMTKHTFLLPIAYRPKSKQSGDIKCKPYWLCICLGCHRFTEATTTDLNRQRAISCAQCAGEAERHLCKQWEYDIVHDTRREYLTRSSYNAMCRRAGVAKTYRTVSICPQWLGQGGYGQFKKDMGLRKHGGLSLERKDVHDGYTPENCIWADRNTQSRNKSTSRVFTVNGKPINLVDLAAMLGQKANLVSRKINRLLEVGFTEPQAVEQILANAHCAA